MGGPKMCLDVVIALNKSAIDKRGVPLISSQTFPSSLDEYKEPEMIKKWI